MPSQAADDLRHELILYTRHYVAFCNHAFGLFMHHTPAAVLGVERQNNAGLLRTWWYALLEENINPSKHTRLPLLFVLDTKMNMADGFRFAPNCGELRKKERPVECSGTSHCGGDFPAQAMTAPLTASAKHHLLEMMASGVIAYGEDVAIDAGLM